MTRRSYYVELSPDGLADDAIRQQAERGLRDRLGEDIAIAWHPHTTFTEEGPVQTFIGVALGEEESS